MKIAVLFCSMLVVSSTASGEPARRSGFTMELGLGYGGLEFAGLDRYGSEKANTGFEPHALSFGGFVTNNLALMARWKSTYQILQRGPDDSVHRFLGTLTAHAQWWFAERWFLGGGVGVATFGFGFGSNPSDPPWSFGGAASARVGFAFARLKHHAFIVSVEVVAGFFRDGAAAGETANLSWQFY
jgi:hypothetical protein